MHIFQERVRRFHMLNNLLYAKAKLGRALLNRSCLLPTRQTLKLLIKTSHISDELNIHLTAIPPFTASLLFPTVFHLAIIYPSLSMPISLKSCFAAKKFHGQEIHLFYCWWNSTLKEYLVPKQEYAFFFGYMRVDRNAYAKGVVPNFLQCCHTFSASVPIFSLLYYGCTSVDVFQQIFQVLTVNAIENSIDSSFG